jgi:hypothetical protein
VKRDDALFNWLQIQVVADARPDDQSALDTAAFFRVMLQEDHGMAELSYRREGDWYVMSGHAQAEEWEGRYPAEAIDALLIAINNEPRYNS